MKKLQWRSISYFTFFDFLKSVKQGLLFLPLQFLQPEFKMIKSLISWYPIAWPPEFECYVISGKNYVFKWCERCLPDWSLQQESWAPGIQLGVNFPNCSRAAILDHPWAEREIERERERDAAKLEIELTLPKQLIPRSSSRDTTTNTVATVATAHAGVCSSDFCCSAIFWSTGPKTNTLHLHTHLQLNPKIFYGIKEKRKKKKKLSKSRSSSSSTTWIVQNLCICSFRN